MLGLKLIHGGVINSTIKGTKLTQNPIDAVPFDFHDDVIKWKETVSALLAICAGNSPFTSEFPAQRPVTRSFYVFFDLRLNKRLSIQSWGWWFETPPRPLWRHCNVIANSDKPFLKIWPINLNAEKHTRGIEFLQYLNTIARGGLGEYSYQVFRDWVITSHSIVQTKNVWKSVPQSWPWVKVVGISSSTLPQAYTFLSYISKSISVIYIYISTLS